jgi:hypothetical protein
MAIPLVFLHFTNNCHLLFQIKVTDDNDEGTDAIDKTFLLPPYMPATNTQIHHSMTFLYLTTGVEICL